MTDWKELPKRMLEKAARDRVLKTELSITEKEKVYREATRYNLLGHRYIGFEGKKCSQMHSSDRKRTMEECAWVWDADKLRWIKRPKENASA